MSVEVVKVPGPARSPFTVRHSGTSAAHVLVLGEIVPEDPTSRDWRIEHPDSCPTFCHWMPEGVDYWGEGEDEYRGPVEHACPVEFEIQYNALDSLDWDGQGWRDEGGYRGLASSLPEGRYVVTVWWHDGYGQGEYGGRGDADATFDLDGPETPLALTYPPNLLNPHVHFTTRTRRYPWPT